MDTQLEHALPIVLWQSMKPVSGFALASILFSVSLHLSSQHRLILAPFLVSAIAMSLASSHHLAWLNGADHLWALFMCATFLHFGSVLYVEQKRLPDKPGRNMTSQSTVHAILDIHNDPRNIMSHHRRERLSRHDSTGGSKFGRLKFGLGKIGRILMLLGIQVVIVGPLVVTNFDFSMDDFSPEHEKYFRRLLRTFLSSSTSVSRVTLRETRIRALMAVEWIWVAYVMLEMCHGLLAVTFVSLLACDNPETWPPLFGSPCEAWNIRRFWGKFWHRLFVRPSTIIGQALCERIPGLRRLDRKSKLYKTVLACWIFLISGTSHALADRVTAVAQGNVAMSNVWFFVVNFMAGAFEPLIAQAIFTGPGAGGKGSDRRLRWLGLTISRKFGWIWVFLFFFWSVPKWQYPGLHAYLRSMPH